MSRSEWTVWGSGGGGRYGYGPVYDLLEHQSSQHGISVESLPDARKRARVFVHARLHLAVLVGMPLEEALPKAPVKMDRDVRVRRHNWETRHEEWGAVLQPDGGWEVVRTVPGPMPVHETKPKVRHKADKPTLVAASDLKAAWALTWMMDPANAVALVESAGRFLKDPEQTRAWFHEGMGGSSLRFLLDLFWPRRLEISPTGADLDIAPLRYGYKVRPGSKESLFRQLLRALGRNDWQRAADTLVDCRVRTTYHCHNRKTGRVTRRTGTIKNGRTIRLHGVSRRRRSACNPAEYKEVLSYGFKPCYAPSVLQLLELRALVTERLRAVRQAERLGVA